MLALAERNVRSAGLTARIRVILGDAKATGSPDGAYDAVLSNSIVHHIPEPATVLGEMWRLVRPGGALFVRDLERPESEAKVASLVETYAPIPDASAPIRAMHERQRALLAASLRAALTSDEIRAMVQLLGIPAAAVRTTSDRHWTLACVRP